MVEGQGDLWWRWLAGRLGLKAPRWRRHKTFRFILFYSALVVHAAAGLELAFMRLEKRLFGGSMSFLMRPESSNQYGGIRLVCGNYSYSSAHVSHGFSISKSMIYSWPIPLHHLISGSPSTMLKVEQLSQLVSLLPVVNLPP